jgi:hypothetical protein
MISEGEPGVNDNFSLREGKTSPGLIRNQLVQDRNSGGFGD